MLKNYLHTVKVCIREELVVVVFFNVVKCAKIPHAYKYISTAHRGTVQTISSLLCMHVSAKSGPVYSMAMI